jgi:tRNA-dihydrouridine synthase
MIGRGAIRNPWLFNQIRQRQTGQNVHRPTGRDLLQYIRALWESQELTDAPEHAQTQRMKKFMNFIGEGICEQFLFEIRRVQTRADFFRTCECYLDHGSSVQFA